MNQRHAAIFLDRDGTINEDVNFLSSPEQIVLIENSAEAIKEANELGLKVIVFTNQSGIARGYFTEEDLHRIHKRLDELLAEKGAKVDAYYYCPHHPTEGNGEYKVECECRKPKDGMLRRASREQNIDLKKSFVIGDRCVDIQAGKTAGATTILVLTGYGKEEYEKCKSENLEPDFVAENLEEAIEIVKKIFNSKKLIDV
ncbi:D-glycero-D-manno-heptose 1,7-bisphosphate phosphatase [Candidatus Kryptonium thompsonii]|uniref:D,D-heptose 1,7-bisphosphate phosphatase n=1 Tax=Candidatus Kryptonium thompsonii TaxID=1633631 RepID=A0A0P1LHQ3_9BACT|nr:D-glycero-beta-D-manno-heptose 1,7-bisphosphate 7-phosphatase [Candidatus Kryptonium thompsoni]CUS76957.1 D-glycero-D-manno-heptose 1,7-bisphosphate phosphatase [Candidatus Kryptonium thompsoni]CUS79438.1 D-glycero-D-manno-heptose 1,7-bisphosphate phosphatase [Candidatus Kryptonium thompsoni]CUS80634.1 D-glycero-D-manno-heptose 1,7-bisphosphate phosphatase [Candidatus Kryptonium thompsoni]CUS81093.1 D-glycero-D-manno-heptose 1,7-bisphosphate phosphatase [Candidatus Kryptonium thompsoni]CUS9